MKDCRVFIGFVRRVFGNSCAILSVFAMVVVSLVGLSCSGSNQITMLVPASGPIVRITSHTTSRTSRKSVGALTYLSGTCEANLGLQFSLGTPSTCDTSGVCTQTSITCSGGGTWSAVVDLSALPLGENLIEISQTNAQNLISIGDNAAQLWVNKVSSVCDTVSQRSLLVGSGYSGTDGSSLYLCSAVQLNDLHNASAALNYKLMSDIDVSGYASLASLFGTTNFSGSFNGNGMDISRWTYNAGALTNIGLFVDGIVTGTITDLHLIDANLTATGADLGFLAGDLSGTISNSSATGTLSGNTQVGGLVGRLRVGGTISNSHFSGTVTGTGNIIAGIAAWTDGTNSISNCYSSGTITGLQYVGGIMGYVSTATSPITSSYSTGTVSGTTKVGGLVGEMTGHISDSYSTASVTGTSQTGGIAGTQRGTSVFTRSYFNGSVSCASYCAGISGDSEGLGSTISRSYSEGTITSTGSYVGGLAGRLKALDTVTNSYSRMTVTATVNAVGGAVGGHYGIASDIYSSGLTTGVLFTGGLLGFCDAGSTTTNSYWDTETSAQAASCAGTGKTTLQMKTPATFNASGANWDITTPIWILLDGNYPTLYW